MPLQRRTLFRFTDYFFESQDRSSIGPKWKHRMSTRVGTCPRLPFRNTGQKLKIHRSCFGCHKIARYDLVILLTFTVLITPSKSNQTYYFERTNERLRMGKIKRLLIISKLRKARSTGNLSPDWTIFRIGGHIKSLHSRCEQGSKVFVCYHFTLQYIIIIII